MGQWHAFWAEADHGNFGSLLQGMDYCSAAQSGSVWEPVEASGRRQVEDMWETGKGCGRVGRGLEGCGKVRKRWEGMGSNRTLQLYIFNKLVIGRWIMMVKEKLIVPYGNRTWTAHFLISRAVKAWRDQCSALGSPALWITKHWDSSQCRHLEPSCIIKCITSTAHH